LKTLLIICAAVVVLQCFTIWKQRSSDKSLPDEAIKSDNWEPPELAENAEAALDRYRPRIMLPWEEHRVAIGASETVEFAKGNTDGRAAKFSLIEGTAVRIAYRNPRDGKWQKLCLCTDGGLSGVTPPPDCGENFSPSACPSKDGLVVVYEEVGEIQLQGLGLAGGTIRHN
jgi:hypothetical protein